MTKSASLDDFRKRIDREVMTHRIITDNKYTEWFEQGRADLDDVRHLIVQFSVFSNFFMVAQLRKVINSESVAEMHMAKEILLNELGVVFRNPQKVEGAVADASVEPDLVGTEGTVDGGTFRFKAAHFEWLVRLVKPLGLKFNDIGKRRHATASTLVFTDGLERIYGSDDFSIGTGASYAIENWAAAGFWKQLIRGLEAFKTKSGVDLPLAFFLWHDKVEEQHKLHTHDELKEVYHYQGFDEDAFVQAGLDILDTCAAFWDGLDQDRLARRAS